MGHEVEVVVDERPREDAHLQHLGEGHTRVRLQVEPDASRLRDLRARVDEVTAHRIDVTFVRLDAELHDGRALVEEHVATHLLVAPSDADVLPLFLDRGDEVAPLQESFELLVTFEIADVFGAHCLRA